ncbi:MAG: serine/threonine-protein kinase [Pseudomonadota bacterium]
MPSPRGASPQPDTAAWDDTDPRSAPTPGEGLDAAAPTGSVPTIGHIGRYALKHRLGEGGIGTVYAAHDPLLSRMIAVKTLHVEVDEAERDAFNALFLNEARAAASLNHANIVTVFDAGISDDRAYIAMELLKGRDLRQLRQEGWRATPEQAALIVRRVADALGYAHSKGVVHRDVKPANIFMIGRTQPKVLDFGIARIAHQHDAQHASGGEIAAGSPYYMAPEQARQEPADGRADVFSLGVVLYELLTDRKPFRGHTLAEITAAVLTHEPPMANAVDAAVPPALAAIAARALAKHPDQRFRSARALARELRHWLDENTVGLDAEAHDPPPAPRHAWWLALGACALLAVGGASSWWLARARPAPDARALATPLLQAVAPEVAPSSPSPSPSPPGTATTVSAAAETAPPAPARERAVPAATARTTQDTPPRRPRERDARAAQPAAPIATGTVRVAVSPWGEIEVDGRPAGTTPPLTELTLPAGMHRIVVRNSDLPAHAVQVQVTPDQPVVLRHRF